MDLDRSGHRRRLLGIGAILAMGLSGAAVASPVLEVQTDRVAYQFGEPVWVYVRVQNPGDAPLAVENPHCSRTVTRLEIVRLVSKNSTNFSVSCGAFSWKPNGVSRMTTSSVPVFVPA